MSRQWWIVLASLFLVACGNGEQAAQATGEVSSAIAEMADAAIATQSPYELAVAHPSRPEADRLRDGDRKPAEILEFFNVAEGMQVLDMFSGGGYYTEILAYLVGPEGKVYAQNNQAYLDFAKDELKTRFADRRLANVERLNIAVADLDLPADAIDVALLILSYHDLYYRPEDDSWPEIDGPAMLSDIYDSLKPGGVLGVVDHSANPGADKIETATGLHRIAMMVVRCEIERAGFAFAGSTDLLRNSQDDLSAPMFAEGIRGKTDRFVLRFHKPIGVGEKAAPTAPCAT
ncbi:MAG: class I SAM-dependent methyltransferase [Proteobacteria bacterium]|nr:class I SAM-dependent methyltransferase [Pseudomonadota bacterium]